MKAGHKGTSQVYGWGQWGGGLHPSWENSDIGCRCHLSAFLALLMIGSKASVFKFQKIDLMVTEMLG